MRTELGKVVGKIIGVGLPPIIATSHISHSLESDEF